MPDMLLALLIGLVVGASFGALVMGALVARAPDRAVAPLVVTAGASPQVAHRGRRRARAAVRRSAPTRVAGAVAAVRRGVPIR